MENKYTLVCVYREPGKAKNKLAKLFFEGNTKHTLEEIDMYTQNNSLDDIKINGLTLKTFDPIAKVKRFYIYDNEDKKVLSTVEDIDLLAKETIKSFYENEKNNKRQIDDKTIRDYFELVFLKDIEEKGSFAHKINDEITAGSKYHTQEKPIYFYGKPKVDIVRDFSYSIMSKSQLEKSSYEYDAASHKYKYIISDNIRYSNPEEITKQETERIGKIFDWFTNYRNFRNYTLFRKNAFENKEDFYGVIKEDMKLISSKIDNKTTETVNIDQENIFDINYDKNENKEEKIEQNEEKQEILDTLEPISSLSNKKIDELTKEADKTNIDIDEYVNDEIDRQNAELKKQRQEPDNETYDLEPEDQELTIRRKLVKEIVKNAEENNYDPDIDMLDKEPDLDKDIEELLELKKQEIKKELEGKELIKK